MIMALHRQPQNQVHDRRTRLGLTQAGLARRAGISRAAVSAIEMGRVIPSVSAALALARVLDAPVEELFGDQRTHTSQPTWAWEPKGPACRYWHARVGERKLLYPVESSPLGVLGHDGVFAAGRFTPRPSIEPEKTLVLVTCDPAASLLADAYAQAAGFRLIVISRSSSQALSLLRQGVIHMAGIHLGHANEPEANARAVKDQLGGGYTLARVCRWQDGIAFSRGRGFSTVQKVVGAGLRWVGREPGSGAHQCLEEILAGQPMPRRTARDHRGVAEAVRAGWADAGVCLRLAGEEAELEFLSFREEAYDLCYPTAWANEPRIRALVSVLRSLSFRKVLDDLPGYKAVDTGALTGVQ
jgi:molybdate-binding protein/DNA-binding XRE family transcriptional regulator